MTRSPCSSLEKRLSPREDAIDWRTCVPPLSPNVSHYLGRLYYFARDLDRAVDQLRTAVELDPQNLWAHLFLGLTYEMQGRDDEALRHRVRSVVLGGASPQIIAKLQEAYSRLGYVPLRHKILDLEAAESRMPLGSSSLSLGYARLGEKEKALYWLEKAFESHTRDLIYMKVEPSYDPLRGDPRFQALLKRLKLPDQKSPPPPFFPTEPFDAGVVSRDGWAPPEKAPGRPSRSHNAYGGKAMFLATVSALLTLALFPTGSPTVEDSSDDKTVVVDRQVLLDDDGGEQIIRIGDGDEPMIIGIGGRRGFIGIRLVQISEDLRKHYGASKDAGVLVSEVGADSPAAKAGIQVGDIITQADGDRVDSARDLSRAVREKKTGDKVRLQVLRDRRAQEVTVTLEEREGREGRIRSFRAPKGKAWSYRMDPERWKPMVLDNLDELPKLQDRLRDLEKRLEELEKRLPAR